MVIGPEVNELVIGEVMQQRRPVHGLIQTAAGEQHPASGERDPDPDHDLVRGLRAARSPGSGHGSDRVERDRRHGHVGEALYAEERHRGASQHRGGRIRERAAMATKIVKDVAFLLKVAGWPTTFDLSLR